MSEKELYDIVAGNIMKLLNWSNRSQADLAKYMNVSQTAVSNWCNGIKMPRMDKIDKICEFFGVNRTELFNNLTHEYLNSKRRTQKLMEIWDALNSDGQEKIIEYANMILKTGDYSSVFQQAEERRA